MQDIKQKLDLI